jgi:hypothetical protein
MSGLGGHAAPARCVEANSRSPDGKKCAHVVAPWPDETGAGVPAAGLTGSRQMRSHPSPGRRAWNDSWAPSNEKYASAFSPSRVSCTRSARKGVSSGSRRASGAAPGGAGAGGPPAPAHASEGNVTIA